MPPKKVFETAELADEYIEFLRKRNRERAEEFYDNKIKTDPGKYKQFFEKYKKPNNDITKNLITKIKIVQGTAGETERDLAATQFTKNCAAIIEF